MSWLDGFRTTVRSLIRPGLARREVEEEFDFHLEQETAQGMACGMKAAEAARAARVRFGSRARFREEVTDIWMGIFSGLIQDARHAVRRLCRRPGFAIISLITLGLGIGANTAIFSLIRSLLYKPLPYSNADRLIAFWQPSGDHTSDTWLSEREVLEYREETVSFERIDAYADYNANLIEGEPERVRAGAVTAGIFETLGVAALHGRTLLPDENLPGRNGVAVLGHGLWQRYFGGATDVVGRTIRVNGQPYAVVGIMPPGFRLPLDYREEQATELWTPAAIDPSRNLPWGNRSYFAIGRLASGVTAARATADLERTLAAWEKMGFVDNSDGRMSRAAVPLDDLLLRSVRPALWILFASVALLLIIACANVAHLMLARSDARRTEIATQGALGASRFRIARQLLIESGLLGVLGAALGVALAFAGIQAALAFAPVNIIRMKGVTLDEEVLVFAILLAVAATAGAGLAPALQLLRTSLTSALACGRADFSSIRSSLRRLLIVTETALSVVLLLGAVLLARSFAQLRRIDLGFETGKALTFRVDLPRADYSKPGQPERFYRELLDRAQELPGVQSAGAARILPLTGAIGNWSITIENRAPREGQHAQADWQVVIPGYLETMRIRLVEGRYLTRADDEGATFVAVVNQTMARRYWPGDTVVGKRFHLGTLDQPWIEVVGVVRNVRHNAVVEDARAEMYLPHAQWVAAKKGGSSQFGMTVVMRTAGAPLTLLPQARMLVRAIDPGLPISDIRTLEEVTAAGIAPQRFTAAAMGVFAGLALALAATGLYGVTAFITARRTREIGIRVALGARTQSVTLLMMRDGLTWAFLGVVVGIITSIWATRLLAGQLYGIRSLDPVTFALAPAILLIAAVLASLLPSYRAARADPVSSLRNE